MPTAERMPVTPLLESSYREVVSNRFREELSPCLSSLTAVFVALPSVNLRAPGPIDEPNNNVGDGGSCCEDLALPVQPGTTPIGPN